jgi:hypothetical protein
MDRDRPAGALFAAPTISLTLEQARAFAAARAGVSAQQRRPVGPPRLRVIENDFLKPATRTVRARTVNDWE